MNNFIAFWVYVSISKTSQKLLQATVLRMKMSLDNERLMHRLKRAVNERSMEILSCQILSYICFDSERWR